MDILALAFLGGLPSYHWGAFPIDNEGKYQQYLGIPCKGKTIGYPDASFTWVRCCSWCFDNRILYRSQALIELNSISLLRGLPSDSWGDFFVVNYYNKIRFGRGEIQVVTIQQPLVPIRLIAIQFTSNDYYLQEQLT